MATVRQLVQLLLFGCFLSCSTSSKFVQKRFEHELEKLVQRERQEIAKTEQLSPYRNDPFWRNLQRGVISDKLDWEVARTIRRIEPAKGNAMDARRRTFIKSLQKNGSLYCLQVLNAQLSLVSDSEFTSYSAASGVNASPFYRPR